MHNGMLNLSGEKMAKSTGHVVTLLDSLEKWDPMAVRLFYLRTHYRKPLEFSSEALADAESSLDRLRAFRRRVPDRVEGEPDRDALDAFTSAMDNDLDVAGGLGVVFDVVRRGNAGLDSGEDVGPLALAFDEMVSVLGLDINTPDLGDIDVDAVASALGVAAVSIEDLLLVRDEARASKDWATADAIREALDAVGIIIEDTPDGARWHRG
jgi:cysteinyl-tRNA synthetase